MMKRIHILTTISVLIALVAASMLGVVGRYGFIMSDSMAHNILRVLLVVSLGLVLVIRRPRSVALRTFCMIVAAGVCVYSFQNMAAGQLGVLDAIAYLLGSYTLMIEALEPKVQRAARLVA